MMLRNLTGKLNVFPCMYGTCEGVLAHWIYEFVYGTCLIWDDSHKYAPCVARSDYYMEKTWKRVDA
jgi:hypothetical protein